jgi:light-regulated signal transduction histidine kinase (bacteriophytochrome)
VVHAGILDRWEFVKAHENELEEYANKLSKKTDDFEVKQAKTALSKAIKRRDELDTLIQRLFEQNAIGLLTNERFLKLATTYENEQTEVKEKIAKLQTRISSDEKERQDVMRFFKLIRKYTEINELDAGILKHLIDNILVHTPSGRGSNRRQKITINFKFIKDHWFSD